MHQPEILRRGVMMNALNREHIKPILCLHCEHMLGLHEAHLEDDEYMPVAKCDRGNGESFHTPLRTRCSKYYADCSKQPEPCNGDCEKCRTRTEWKEWSE